MEYNFKEIEAKWQSRWRSDKTYKVETDPSRPKFYVLDMFPYPSGAGLHVGNPEGFKTAGLFDLGAVSVDVDNSTLLSDVIVIKEISIDGLALTYEQGLRGSNLGALIDQLSAGQ